MVGEFKNPWETTDREKNKEKSKEGEGSFIGFSFTIDGGGGGKKNGPGMGKPKTKQIIHIILLLLGVWLLSGVYKVETNQQGIVMYFGKFYKITNPGLNYMLPVPIGTLHRVPVTNINKEEFGFRTGTNKGGSVNMNDESLMLTGDENIVDIDFEVQWRIKDAKNYLFNIRNPLLTIRMATESAMREIIARRKIDDVLASKKSDISQEALTLLQNILDSYNSGIEILLIQLLRVDPPSEVIGAFRDVQTAKADKERKINEAETYKNDVMPRARGEVESIIMEAEGYKQSVIANTEGEVANFLKVYQEYRKNPVLTKKRIYLETMENIMKDVDKTIIDSKIGSRVLGHFQLDTGGK
ncbi:MAG: FtsH protease activity modulator HflK [Rickettsiales bacterium]|jgi:membrane protease subunit HflK|nr:FtsH protease activity modulator HflK [Rickettsiales bacterium]